ncbi:MAG: hypothetical protein J1F12_01825 [Muribaculaceae bacterium]|nr:hypothetical protein [Muribaculaceae bacterium]
MRRRYENAKERWRVLRSTSGFKNAMLFLIFVIVSAVFWFILALNDSAQDHFNVNIRIVNQPDSVTFISDVPERLHVSVSDKGTNLWRNGYLKHPTINIDFKEYAGDGILKYSYNDLISSLRESFGGSALITSVSLDSLQLSYTTNPGKKVPILVNCQVFPSSGTTLEGSVKASPGSVTVYGTKEVLDTIHYVSTEPVVLRDINETTVMEVKVSKLSKARAIPAKVVLTVPIEPLVQKQALITVDTENVPEGEELLLFPSKVPVEYYVAMSRLNDDEDSNIKLVVNYNDVHATHNGKLPISTRKFPDRLKNLRLKTDSVEYAIVKD